MRDRVRILSVIGDLGFGGGENRLLALARNIDRARFEHIVTTINEPDPQREETRAMRRHYAEAGVVLTNLGEGFSRTKVNSVLRKGHALRRRVRKLCGAIRELDIDVVDAHLEPAALAGVMAATLTGTRSTVTLYHARPLVRKRFWFLAQQFILHNANVILTDSHVRGREIQRASLWRRPRVMVIPNGVSPPEAVRSRDEIRHVLGIPDDPRICVIGQISALVEFKGHLVLLEAAQYVLRRMPNAFFLFVGYERHEPDYRKRLERKAMDLGIGDRVRIASYPGPIGDVWSLIDIHVHASLFDSLPNAVLEGMALRKPAVVTAVGGIRDAVAHGRTGLVVPSGDAAALAEALLRFLENPDFAHACGHAAFSRYLDRYQAGAAARKVERCFLELVGARD